MEIVYANISGEIEKKRFLGEDYIVVPMTMLVEGVLSGSKGPYYYPAEVVQSDPSVWDAMPIVLNHPMVNGQHVTARHPDILEKYGLGQVFNSNVNDSKLGAYAYLNVRRMKGLQPSLYDRVMNKEPVELSTGLIRVTTDENPGVFNGKEYIGSISSYVPDHLAILPYDKGACSNEDGCGLFNKDTDISNVSILDKIKKLLGFEIKEQKGMNEIQDDLLALVKDTSSGYDYTWIVNVYADHFIYCDDQKYYKQSFTISDDNVVSLVGDRTEVQRTVVYNQNSEEADDTPEGGSSDIVTSNDGEPPMANLTPDQRKKLIETITANCKCQESKESVFTNEELEKFSDAQLTLVANTSKKKEATSPEPETKTTPVTNEVDQNEWRKGVPQNILDMIDNHVERDTQHKNALVERIVANERNEYSKDELSGKTVSELEKIDRMVNGAQQQGNGQPQYFGPGPGSFGGTVSNQQKKPVLNQESRMKPPGVSWMASNPELQKS